MSRNLEQFIRENREQFNDEQAPETVWNGIEERMFTKPMKPEVRIVNWWRWSAAAAVIIILAGSIYFISHTNSKPGGTDLATIHTSPYEQQLFQYTKLVEMNREQLEKNKKDYPELCAQFTSDINKLDSLYQGLRSELSVAPDNETVYKAMIQNLKMQLDILTDQLNIIQQIKQSKNKNDESNISVEG